jgi:hypothetical protein
METNEKREATLKAKCLDAVKAQPGVNALALPQIQRRFLRILEKERQIEYRCDAGGENPGWYETYPSDEYEHDSIHGKNANQ